ncbi:helix-turn-helix transcriptional regulator [Kutzneria viridogrisea]
MPQPGESGRYSSRRQGTLSVTGTVTEGLTQMAHSPGRTVLRRQLGRELRRLREAAGKTVEDAAEWAGVQKPTISKMENGRQAIRPTNVRLLAQLYGASEELTADLLKRAAESTEPSPWAAYADTMPDSFTRYAELEADTVRIDGYDTELVPGLLQSEGYIEAVVRAARPGITDAALAKSVNFQLARQHRLLDKNPPRLRFVLNEGVLLRRVGGLETYSEQLRALIEANERSYVDLHVLPFAVGEHPAMGSSFKVLEFTDHELDFVYLENNSGATYLEGVEDRDEYRHIMDRLVGLSDDSQATSERLAKLVETCDSERKGYGDDSGPH